LVKIPNLFCILSARGSAAKDTIQRYQYFAGLARSLQSPWHRRPGWSGSPSSGIRTMSLRFENAQRFAFSLVAAFAFTVVMFSAAVSVGPVA